MRFKNLSYLNRKGPRYTKQRLSDKYSCAAIALLNIDKWKGKKCTNKDLSEYRKILSINRRGPTTEEVTDFLYRKNISKSLIEAPSLENIDSILQNGGIAYVSCLHENQSMEIFPIISHAFLVVSKTKKGYKCVNLYTGHTLSFVSKSELSRLLNIKSEFLNITSRAWPIYKETHKNEQTIHNR